MLSTKDNPYNPFTQFDQWYNYDMDLGYDSSGYLARIVRTSDTFTDDENNLLIEGAIDDIIRLDFLNLYIKVKSTD